MGTPPIPLRGTGGEVEKCRFEYFKLLHCRVPVALWSISVSLSETFKTPPLCGASHIGEVARSDGGVENSPSSAGLYRTNHIFTIRLGDPLQEQPIQ